MTRVEARRDPNLRATLGRRLAMRYAGGADAATDRPAHVRAASGLAWVGDRLALAQDDANFIALVDPATGLAEPITLPAGPGGRRQFGDDRGNKRHKLDLEAILSVGDGAGTLLLALGSGSTDARERAVVVRDAGSPSPTVAVRALPDFYAALRATAGFAGSELNVEGLQLLGDRLRLFARGNGEARAGTRRIDATCEVDWPAFLAHLEDPAAAPAPVPARVVGYALGTLRDVRLGFTDAAVVPSVAPVRRTLFTAAAEASPDAVQDGEVAGSAIGVIVERGDQVEARWTELLDAEGRPCAVKVEGIAPLPGVRGRVLVVIDADDPHAPSELCEVHLAGGWDEG